MSALQNKGFVMRNVNGHLVQSPPCWQTLSLCPQRVNIASEKVAGSDNVGWLQPCILQGFSTCLPHLNESDLALTYITAGVSDGDLPIVLNPALSTKNVVDAGRHLVPLIVVSKSREMELKALAYSRCVCLSVQS